MVLAVSRRLWPETTTGHRWLAAILSLIACACLGARMFDLVHSTEHQGVPTVSGIVLLLGLLLTVFLLMTIDLSLHRLPNDATFILAVLGLVFFTWLRIFGDPQLALWRAAAAATLLPIVLLVLHLLSPRSLGFGDVKLGVGLGLLLGNFGGLTGLLGLFLAALLASGHFLILLPRSNRGLKTTAAFGPWLILGSSLALYMS